MSSFLQTKEWMEFQKSLGREVFSVGTDNIDSGVIKHDGPLGINYLYVPHGPEIDFNSLTGGFDNPVRQFITQLKNLAKKEKAIFVKAEPMEDSVAQLLVKSGFKRSKKEVQPHKTVVLDLDKSEEELLAGMHHKTRYNIKVAEKHEITVKPSEDIDAFWELLQKTTKRDRFGGHVKDYYRKLLQYFHDEVKTFLMLAYHKDQPVAAAIVLLYGDHAYYLHGASDHNFRSYMAPYMLHWEIIKHLKQNNSKSYDLWGIDADKWPGVTRFKLGWGGRQVEYPGSFDLPISKFWYFIYKIYRAILK